MTSLFAVRRRVPALLTAALLVALLGLGGRVRAASGTLLQLPVDSAAVFVNGAKTTLDVPAQIQDGRTLVPLRFVGESLGATIDWDDTQRMVTYTLGTTQIKLVIDSPNAQVNGAGVTLDVPPRLISDRTMVPVRLISDRTMVPVRFVSETLGAVVGWEAATRTVWVALGDLPNLVLIRGFAFAQPGFTVTAGTPVVFVNQDRSLHTVEGYAFDSGDLNRGDAFVVTNLAPGSYTVHCGRHLSMEMTFTVKPNA